MAKKISIVVFFILFGLINTSTTIAAGKDVGGECDPTDEIQNHDCKTDLFCNPSREDPEQGSCSTKIAIGGTCFPTDDVPNNGCANSLFCNPTKKDPEQGSCEVGTSFQGIFGKIQPPDALKGFLQKDPTGAGAISQFLSNFVALLFSIAAIVLIFMILWGAFEWLTSGGDKEKLSSAQKRIINAFIGIILFAVAFAIIRVVGTFTGFTFFAGQNAQIIQKLSDGRIQYTCPPDNRVKVDKVPKCP